MFFPGHLSLSAARLGRGHNTRSFLASLSDVSLAKTPEEEADFGLTQVYSCDPATG